MSDPSILSVCFDDVAGHITNLETVKTWIDEVLREEKTLQGCLEKLKRRAEEGDVTIQTDMRILINAVEHELRKRRTR